MNTSIYNIQYILKFKHPMFKERCIVKATALDRVTLVKAQVKEQDTKKELTFKILVNCIRGNQ